jgi:hypothetical protein
MTLAWVTKAINEVLEYSHVKAERLEPLDVVRVGLGALDGVRGIVWCDVAADRMVFVRDQVSGMGQILRSLDRPNACYPLIAKFRGVSVYSVPGGIMEQWLRLQDQLGEVNAATETDPSRVLGAVRRWLGVRP